MASPPIFRFRAIGFRPLNPVRLIKPAAPLKPTSRDAPRPSTLAAPVTGAAMHLAAVGTSSLRINKFVTRWNRHALVGLILLSIPVFFWPALKLPLERDEGEYAWAADVLARGLLPYRDTFLQKPPGIVLIYRAIFRTLGTSPVAIHCGLVLAYIATAYLLNRIGRQIGGWQGGLWAALLFVLCLVIPLYEATAANTEAFMILPVAAAMACLWRIRECGSKGGRVAVLGLLFGIAIFIKQVAIYHGLHLAMSLWVLGKGRSERLRWLAIFAGFGMLPYGAWIGWSASHGALMPFFDCVLLHNLEYISVNLEGSPLLLLLRRLHRFSGFDIALWFGAAASIWVIVSRRREWWLGWFLGGWFVTAVWGLSSGGYFRGHYFIQALPPVCLAAAWGFRRCGRATPYFAVALAIAWAVCRPWMFGKGPQQLSFERSGVSRFVNAVSVGEWLIAAGGQSVYILGSEPEIYHYANCRTVTRYVISNPLFGGFKSSGHRQREVLDALQETVPDSIIVTDFSSIPAFPQSDRTLYDGVQQLLENRYRLVALTSQDEAGILDPTSSTGHAPMSVDLAVYVRQDHASHDLASAGPNGLIPPTGARNVGERR